MAFSGQYDTFEQQRRRRGRPATGDRVTAAVLTAPPGELPVLSDEVTLAVLPGFNLCRGSPEDGASAQVAAQHWDSALARVVEFGRADGCEVVTSLMEVGDAGRLHHTVIAVDRDAKDQEPVSLPRCKPQPRLPYEPL